MSRPAASWSEVLTDVNARDIYFYGTAGFLIAQGLPLIIALLGADSSTFKDLDTLQTYGIQILRVLFGIYTATSPTQSTLQVTVGYHVMTGVYEYVTYTQARAKDLWVNPLTNQDVPFGVVVSAALAMLGGGLLLFGNERLRGSGWLFESSQSKAARRERHRIAKDERKSERKKTG